MKNANLGANANRPWAAMLSAVAMSLAIVGANTTSNAQSFSTGSDGSDGALTLTTPGTVIFDPFDSARFGKVLDADGDGVYNFTTITIGPDVTVRLTGEKINRPVYWLASGDVIVNGTIDLNGAEGPRQTSDFDLRRQVARPGSGGYAGGAGGSDALAATSGEGPGGGSLPGPACECGTSGFCGAAGEFRGNRFLVPLVGGSGGGGTTLAVSSICFTHPNVFGPGGGAGGGAILIASSTSSQ